MMTRWWRNGLVLTLALWVAGVLLLGCQAGPVVASGGGANSTPDPLVSTWVYVPAPTATLYPTFTPVPTPEPTAAPVGAVAAESVRENAPVEGSTTGPGRVIVPSGDVEGGDDVSDGPGGDGGERLAVPTPTPASFGWIDGTDLRVRDHTLFMMRTSELPDFWPDGRRVFFSRTARYLVWMVDFDLGDVDSPEDADLPGLMRWLWVDGETEQVVRQQPFRLEGPNTLLVFMLGAPVPGYWRQGSYQVELWDHLDRPFIDWEFEVR